MSATLSRIVRRLAGALSALLIGSVLAAGAAAGPAVAVTSPLGRPIYVDPNNAAALDATAARLQGRVSTAARLDVIGSQPQAKWFGDWFTVAEIAIELARNAGG